MLTKTLRFLFCLLFKAHMDLENFPVCFFFPEFLKCSSLASCNDCNVCTWHAMEINEIDVPYKNWQHGFVTSNI